MRQFVDSGELTNALFDALPDALVLVDERGRIADVNARVVDLLGYAGTELLGQPVELLIPDQQRVAHALASEAYWKNPTRRPMAAGRDLIARHKNGSAVSVLIALSPLAARDRRYVVAVLRETPDDLRALRTAEERYRSAIEQAPDAVFVADLEGRYTDVNSAACRMLGYTRHELIGRTIMSLLPADDLARLAASRTQLLKPGEVQVSEWTLIRADGVRLPVEVSAKIHPDGRWQAFARDISDRKRLEAALGERDRLATVGTLAAGVGHEINNPLQHVTMTLELLREELTAVSNELSTDRLTELLELVTDARQGAERIAKIVRGLHTFARGEREESADLNVVSVLELSLSLTRNQLRPHVRLFTELRPTPMVFCDESRLVQVFINLLTNAAQAMADRPVARNALHVCSWTDELGRAVVEVRDTGPGMTADVRARIFEPFFTTKPVGQGSGLGLAIAHSIVASLGGELSCKSQLGVGSTFRVTLPQSPQNDAPSNAKPRQSGSVPRRGRILVVEDDPVVASLIERALKADHYVERAADGLEGLALLSSQPAYDIILCDLTMPHMTGIELYQRVARERPEVAENFVFMTGGATGGAQEFLDSVPNEKLAKPFSIQALLSLAAALLHRRVAERAPARAR
jgi:PAS domain S-box-containing protein